ncbi:MAG: tape measure protein [Sphaerochaeta sp.]|nr:tape measure protein [Sphaerochaeta sp.]
MERSGTNMDRHFGETFKKIAKGAAIAFAGMATGVALLGREMLEGAGEVERYRAILETVTGSAEVAGQKLDWLREFAEKTPFELPGLMDAAVKLEAYGFAAEEYMTVLGDTAAAMGKDVGDAVEALADATMGEFERLKEFGIKATTEGAQIAFNYTDKSGQQQKALVDKNNKEMIASTLTAIWNERYEGAMEKMSTTWEGMVSNLKDSWSTVMADVGASIMPTMKPFLTEVIDFVGGDTMKGALTELSGAFVDIAKAGMDVFESIAPLLADVAGLVGEITEEFGPVISEVLGRLGEIVGDVISQMTESGLIESLAEIAGILSDSILDVLEDILPIVIPIVDAFVSLAKPLLDIANKAGILQALIYAWAGAKVVGGITALAGGFAGIASSVAGIGTAAAGAQGAVGGLSGALSGLSGIGIGAAAVGIYAITDAAKKYFQASEELMRSQVAEMKTVATAWGEMGEDAYNNINAWLNEMGIAGETAVQTFEEGYRAIIEGGIKMGHDMKAVPPIITQALESEIPELEAVGWEGMEGYLGQMLAATGQIAPDQIGAVNAKITADLKSGDPDRQQSAIDSMKGYLDAMVENSTLTPGQRDAILSSIKDSLDISGSLYSWGEYMGRSYLNGLAAAVGGTVVPGVGVSVQAPGGTGRQILHEGGLVLHGGGIAAIRAHSGYLAPREVPAILERGEHVTRASSVTPRTLPVLSAINAQGDRALGGGGGITLNGPVTIKANNPAEFEAWGRAKMQQTQLRGAVLP